MADIAIQPVWQVLDGNGNPLPGAKVTFYNTGTVTPQTVYQDTGLTTPHASPVVANANGVLPAIYLTGSIVAKAVITTSTGAAVATVDPLPADALTASSASQISFTPSVVNVTTNVQAAIDNIDGRIGAVSAYAKTILDDATAGAALTTLGVSAFAQTVLDDADKSAVATTLGYKQAVPVSKKGTSGAGATNFAVTTASFTAPCDGTVKISGGFDATVAFNAATSTLTASLGAVTNADGTSGPRSYGTIAMTAGQSSTFTVTVTNGTAGFLQAWVTMEFIPTP